MYKLNKKNTEAHLNLKILNPTCKCIEIWLRFDPDEQM